MMAGEITDRLVPWLEDGWAFLFPEDENSLMALRQNMLPEDIMQVIMPVVRGCFTGFYLVKKDGFPTSEPKDVGRIRIIAIRNGERNGLPEVQYATFGEGGETIAECVTLIMQALLNKNR